MSGHPLHISSLAHTAVTRKAGGAPEAPHALRPAPAYAPAPGPAVPGKAMRPIPEEVPGACHLSGQVSLAGHRDESRPS